MKFSVDTDSAERLRTACIVVGVLEKRELSPTGRRIDELSDGFLESILRRGDMDGKSEQALLLHGVPNIPAERVLLVGCGKPGKLDGRQFAKAVARAASALAETGAKDAVNCLPELDVKDRGTYWKVRQSVTATREALYRFDKLKKGPNGQRPSLKRMTLMLPGQRDRPEAERGVLQGAALAAGIALARELGNLPPNICTPGYLASQAKKLGRKHKGLVTTIINEKEMKKLGMEALLSVSRGSRQPAKLCVLEYKGGPEKEAPIVLVGKGVTFDSGGISIKPAQAMDEMKFDMCGAASVLGVVHTVSELELPINVVGLIPATENLPSGTASKPGDVVTSASGKTIEILNTDAEGRLILCDALNYADRFKPEVVVDIATLTGACVVALGAHASGLMGNDQGLLDNLLSAGEYANDRAWQLPLWEDYQEQLKSNFADMANIGGREAGAITAGCFLSRFTEDFRWAHLDIAGTAWKSGKAKGATGRPVALLVQYVLDRIHRD